jgi:para-aminobenzoate synthetase component 1
MVTQEVELPVSPAVLLTRCAGEPYVFALDGGDVRSWGSGHALLGFGPRATLRVAATGAALVHADGVPARWHGDPFTLLDRFCAEWNQAPATSSQPDRFAGGVIAALSYDLREYVEPRPGRRRDGLELPLLHAAFYEWLLSYSYVERRYRLASAHCGHAHLEHVAGRLQALAGRPVSAAGAGVGTRVVPDFTREQYLTAVRAVLQYVAAGDAYQVNLAQRFVVTNPPAPAALFASLQQEHVMPFAAYVDVGDCVLVSNSPECFLTLRGRRLATFPVKGTRRRGADVQSDSALVRSLHADPKERAEHVMIVDLERNDLGKVCRTGSVQVEEFGRVCTFPSLHHLVSKVSGAVRPQTPLAEVLRATFPGGSITGAPKIRAMEIIDELEPVRRGFYTGAIGFIGGVDDATFNLAIRTVVASQQRMTYHAGGGIVADSVPDREYEETLLKAQPFLTALTPRAA